MTDSRKSPKPRPIRYPRSLSIMVTEETYRAIADEAIEESKPGEKVSKAAIARRYFDIGRGVAAAAESAVD